MREDRRNPSQCPPNQSIKIGPLKEHELEEAHRIVRLAFGTFLGVPNPVEFMGDRNFMTPRWRSTHTKVIAARDGDRLIGSNVATRWGSFGFFGPLTVLPEYWDRGVAQRLLESTMTIFDRWGVQRTGLFTFPHSAKHVGLYQKYGYWPGYLTAVMTRTPDVNAAQHAPALILALKKADRESASKHAPSSPTKSKKDSTSPEKSAPCSRSTPAKSC